MFKKKFGVLVVLLLLVICMTGCGSKNANSNTSNNSNSKDSTAATIVDNNGETQKMTSKDLAKAYETNEAKFKKNYTGADITIIGTFKSVKEKSETPTINGQVKFVDAYEIELNEDWIVIINKEGNEDLIADLDEGDKVEIKSNIAMGWNGSATRIFTVVKDSDGNPIFDQIGWPQYEYVNNNTSIKKIN